MLGKQNVQQQFNSSHLFLKQTDKNLRDTFETQKNSISKVQENKANFPSFTTGALQFQILPLKKEFRLGGIKTTNKMDYSVFTESTLPKDNKSTIKQPLNGLRILCTNCDFNKYDRKDRPQRKVYYNTSPSQRANQILNVIGQAMKEKVDFILLQEVSEIKQKLQQKLNYWNLKNHDTYYYPDYLQKKYEEKGTLILSRHQVKFGIMRFFIKEHQNQKEGVFYTPTQGYCQFQINMNGTKQNLCILSCHLRSSAEHHPFLLPPSQMRLKQFQCIQDFSKRFDRFFCIGDINTDQKMSQFFVDPVDLGQAQNRGTFLFRKNSNLIIDERLDRVLMSKNNKQDTMAQINYQDVLLKSCQGKGWSQKEIFRENPNQLIHITVTNHTILNVSINFSQ